MDVSSKEDQKSSEEQKVGDDATQTQKEMLKSKPSQGRIMQIQYNIITFILDFLDVPSICCFSVTNSDFLKFKENVFLFKKFCVALYKPVPVLPDTTVFQPLEQYIIDRPLEFDHILRLRAMQNIRQVVWDDIVPENQTTSKAYFQQFGSYPNMFMKAPRVNYCGVYHIKEKYIKVGERSISSQYDPLITVYYQRYVRFLPDGRFKTCVSVKKMEKQQIINLFSESPDPKPQHQQPIQHAQQ